MSKTIALAKGKGVAIVDDQDYDKCVRHSWRLKIDGRRSYAEATIGRKTIGLHRFVLNDPAGRLVDHINEDGLDCRRDNLRNCNQSQNMFNRGSQSNSKSGIKGVSWSATRNKWRADICAKGKKKTLGYFQTIEAATNAYDNAAAELHGEFARPNVRDTSVEPWLARLVASLKGQTEDKPA